MKADKYVQDGRLANDTLDRAVGNILAKKFAMRLFDSPTLDPAMAANINSDSHRRAAREAAIQGCVLLKNDGGMLPVSTTAVKKVTVVGPFADSGMAQLGGYSSGEGGGRITVTVAGALSARPGLSVSVIQGSDGGRGGPATPRAGQDINAAVAASETADFTVVVVGTMACGCCDQCGNGELGDRASLDMEGQQSELIAAIANISTSKPGHKWAVVLIHGRPVSWGPDNTLLDKVPALLAAWRPGQEGGGAVVDILFGDANPSGKLAQAWPRSAGHIHGPSNPWYQSHTSMVPIKCTHRYNRRQKQDKVVLRVVSRAAQFNFRPVDPAVTTGRVAGHTMDMETGPRSRHSFHLVILNL